MDIKHIRIVKLLRRAKWLRHAKRFLMPQAEVRRLEQRPALQQAALARHCARWPEQVHILETGLSKCLIDSQLTEDEHRRLWEDVLFCHFAYGFSVSEYLCYGLREKNAAERRAFASEQDSILLGYLVNDIEDMAVLNDKQRTYDRFRPYYHRQILSMNREEDRRALPQFLRTHPVFVKKDNFQACGRGVEKITVGDDLDSLCQTLTQSHNTVMEELIQQAPALGNFHPASVNTVRVITIRTQKGILCPYTFFKVGRQGAFVDNGGAGGILVGIDPKTGVLATDGVDEDNHRFACHPDSGIPFQGYQLPDWDTLLALCSQMSAALPRVRLIGWDMAYTADGWVVVEGNSMTEVIGPQATFQRGIRTELLELLGL